MKSRNKNRSNEIVNLEEESSYWKKDIFKILSLLKTASNYKYFDKVSQKIAKFILKAILLDYHSTQGSILGDSQLI